MHFFSGSYKQEDVIFLLKPIDIKSTDILEKERRIQSGRYHYSEMISEEYLVSDTYLKVFHDSVERNKHTMAWHTVQLARLISERISKRITIVSLARAGTPIGILLKRVLSIYFNKEVTHYSISIIRDRGIDTNALLYILYQANHMPEKIVFVDGWTGKGVISQELKKAIRGFNTKYGTQLSDRLYVLSDLCGYADISASCQDYLIPSSVLNATISGLVSRSILNQHHIGKDDFHGCVYYKKFENMDLSNWFVDEISEEIRRIDKAVGITNLLAEGIGEDTKKRLQEKSRDFLKQVMEIHGVKNMNYVKPGIGEATRVLLRRVPDKLLIKNKDGHDIQHLIVLAEEKHIPVLIDKDLPYNAAAFIQKVKL